MKKYSVLALLAIIAMVASTTMVAADKGKGKGKDALSVAVCPVSGKKINPEVMVDYKEGHVYLCCEGCPTPFKNKTAQFASKANLQLVQTGQYEQTACPVSGRDLNPATVVKINGVATTYCCNNCKGKAKAKEGAEQVDFVFNDAAFAKGFSKVQQN